MAEETPRQRRRHPAHVTADRLKDHYERWFDLMTGLDRDDFCGVINVLEEIAEGVRSTDSEPWG